MHSVPGMSLGTMIPYTAMDYAAVAGAYQRHQSPAFTHSCILELRKEKSRDAARSRRGKENFEFYELAKMLPLPAAITSQLDKASIIRLTISYLKLKDFSAHGDPPWKNATTDKKGNSRPRSTGNVTLDLFEQHQGTHILQSLDGFAFSLAADGRFLYISETVSIYLGLSQVEMTGSSVFDYIHQGDHAELAEQLGLGLATSSSASVPSPSGSDDGSNSATNNPDGNYNPDVSSLMSITSNAGYKGWDRAFCIRMKSTLTKRGCHFKSSGYRVVMVLARLRPQYSFSHSRKTPPPLLGMVALAIALPPPSVHEIRLESDMLVMRVTFDFRIVHVEPRVSELLDYTSEELTGKNLYSLCYGEDVSKMRKCHVDLLNKGQVMSQYYRLMSKNGGYIWLQSFASQYSTQKNSDEQSIIFVNYIMSGKEHTSVVMDSSQLEQETLPQVKREIIDERERKTPESPDESSRGREGGLGSFLDPKRSPNGRSGESERSSDTDTGTTGRERRANLHQRSNSNQNSKANTNNSRVTDESNSSVLQEPLTPISSSTPEQDARTPQSVRSLESEPSVVNIPPTQPPVTKTTNQRKRKMGGGRISGGGGDENHIQIDSALPVNTNHIETPCAKRQIIVQNEVLNTSPIVNGTTAVTPIHQESSSPHQATQNNNSIETENSGDSSRWRKLNHHTNSQSQWDASSGSSVKDLEQVMSKHLPGRENEHISSIVTSDFSTDSLLRQQSRSSGSAIHWVGQTQSTPGLPVSALLRQLCASRESVIRANVQAAAAAVAAARGSSTYYPDMTVQSALPTPPGSDNYVSESQFMLSSQKTASDFASLVPYPPPVSSYDYQSAMTPPASVSPRDKPPYANNVTNGDTMNNTGYADTSFRPPQTYLDGPAQPLPLKPQVYGYHPHSTLESQHYGNPLTESQSQFYPSPHAGFHLYHHPGKPSPYGDPLKNSNWYSAPN